MIHWRRKEVQEMDRYVTGEVIKRLRESKRLTQEELAEKICVSSKAVSKWETGRGYPDISLLEPLADALGISVIELLSGNHVTNVNRTANMARGKWYVCPVCGNVIRSTGEAVISCCGVTLVPAEPEEMDETDCIRKDIAEDEYYVTVPHDMSKTHYISYIMALKDDGWEIIKLYPEGNAEARFKICKTKCFCYFCNKHGLFRTSVR